MNLLKKKIFEDSENGLYLEATDVLDEAARLKIERTKKALLFLKKTNSYKLASEIDNYVIEAPTRSWLNSVLDDLDAAIKSRRYIDPKRWISCSKKNYSRLLHNIC